MMIKIYIFLIWYLYNTLKGVLDFLQRVIIYWKIVIDMFFFFFKNFISI